MRSLSVLPHELPAAVEKIQAESKQARKTHHAAAVGARGSRGRTLSLRRRTWTACGAWRTSWTAGTSRASRQSPLPWPPGVVAAALVGTSAPIAVVVARSAGVALDANAVLQQLLTRFGGRGGGKPELAQGAGLTGETQEIVAAARALLGA